MSASVRALRALPFSLFAVLLLSFPLQALAANHGIIDGDVRDYGGQGIAQATVRLLARDGREVGRRVSDAKGHFEFQQVSFGSYRIEVVLADGRGEKQEVKVSSGDVVAIEVFIPLVGQEVEIEVERPKAPPPAKTASSASTLDRQAIQDLPRGDTASVNDILATQPGFVGDAFGNLYSRGNHANLQYQVDGVPLPDSVSGLFGGFLSPKLVESMEVITGGLGAEYGDRLAGVVNLGTRRPSKEGQGEVELVGGSYQSLNPSASYGRQFGPLSVLLGGSYRYTQRALDPQAFEDLSHDSGDEERAYLKLDYAFEEHTHLLALGTFAHNFYRLPIDPSVAPYDPSVASGGRSPDGYGNPPPRFFPRDTNQSENERDLYAMLSLRHDFIEARASLRVSASYRHSSGFLFGDAGHALGSTADPCTTDAGCASASDVGRASDHVGLDVEQQVRIGEQHVVKLGGQVDQLFGSSTYTAYTRSDALQGPDPSLTVRGTDDARATTAGAYVQDRISLGRFVINAGLRFDVQAVHFAGSDSGATSVGLSPRLGVAYSVTDDLVCHAFAGLLWQPPAPLDAPAAARILGLIQPGQQATYDLLPEQDRYAEVGVETRPLPALSLKLTAWGRLSSDQLDDVGVGSTNLVSPYNFREGRAGGLEAGAVFVLGRLNAFANAALEEAQGRGIETARYLFPADALASDSWQLLDHTQTWTANAGATVKDGFSQLSAAVGYGSGLRTGSNNLQHVPGHLKADLSLQHQFFEAAGKPTVGIDVVNLFDARYAYRIANGFNGSHYAPGRSVFVRVGAAF